MKNFNLLRKSERKSVGTTLALTVGSPSFDRRGTMLKHYAFMLLFLLGSLNVWGENIDITASTLSLSGSNYTSSSSGVAVDGVTIKFTDCNVTNGVCMKKSTGCIWNSSAMPQNIDSIVMSAVGHSSSSSAGFYVYGATTEKGETTKIYESTGTKGKIKIDFTSYSYTLVSR